MASVYIHKINFFLSNWLFLTTSQAKENEKKNLEFKIDIHSSYWNTS